MFANHILGKSTLPVKERELVLRIITCANPATNGSMVIARNAGMTDEDILASGLQTPGLSPLYGCYCRPPTNCTRTPTSATPPGALTEHLNQQQMDLVFTVGQYNLVSMALNSFGVQLDDGVD